MVDTLPNAIFIVVVICTQPMPVKSLIFLFSFCHSFLFLSLSLLSSHTRTARSLSTLQWTNRKKKCDFYSIKSPFDTNCTPAEYYCHSRVRDKYEFNIKGTFSPQKWKQIKNSHVLVNWWTNHNYMLSRNSETSSTYLLFVVVVFVYSTFAYSLMWCHLCVRHGKIKIIFST